jgi:hypothetical protein
VHPEILRALAREHQAELLRHRHFRHRDEHRSLRGSRPDLGRGRRTRQALGLKLVGAGTRLIGGNPGPINLSNPPR